MDQLKVVILVQHVDFDIGYPQVDIIRAGSPLLNDLRVSRV